MTARKIDQTLKFISSKVIKALTVNLVEVKDEKSERGRERGSKVEREG